MGQTLRAIQSSPPATSRDIIRVLRFIDLCQSKRKQVTWENDWSWTQPFSVRREYLQLNPLQLHL